MTPRFIIRELTETTDIAAAFALMSLLRPRLAADSFVQTVQAQRQGGYRLLGGFADGALVVLAGVRDGMTLSRGPHLFIDDLVTAPLFRCRGFGGQMLSWLAADATSRGLKSIWLDSRDTAAGFYQQAGFTFSTSVPCWIDTAALAEKD